MAILIGLKNIFNILLNITLHIFTPAIETPLFIITASAPLPTLLDLTLSTSLLFSSPQVAAYRDTAAPQYAFSYGEGSVD